MVFTTSSHRFLFRAVAVACLVVIGLQTAGCGMATRWVIDPQYYFLEPTVPSLGGDRTPCVPSGKPAPQANARFKASDELAYIYAECVKNMLRARMNLASIARLTSSTFAVLTAAAAAALGAVATAPLTAITALAATSAVTPEVMRIFGADDRARAFEDGVRMIAKAQTDYLEARTHLGALETLPQLLTSDGAYLVAQTAAALTVVENLLVSQLPKVEDILLAQGRVRKIAEVRVALSQTTDRTVVAAADGTTATTTRKVVYTVTATNVSATAVGPAVLNVEVSGTKDWKQKGTATNATCNQDAAKENLRCTVTTLAASGVVKVEIEAVAPAAILTPQRLHFTGQVWDDSTKIPLSGAPTPLIVSVAAQ